MPSAVLPALGPASDAAGELLAAFLGDTGYGFLLVFARLGTAAMLLPGYGELWVPARVRLMFALALCLVVTPLLLPQMPPAPPAPALMALHLGRETLTGLFLGFCIRLVVAAALMAGSLVALQAGLANALQPGVVNPDATATVGIFTSLLLLAFIVNTGLDHMMLRAVVRSYAVLPPPAAGIAMAPVGDLALAVVRGVAGSFALAVQIAFPVLLAGFLVNLGLGLANRFMPQLQVYFLGLPVTIVVALGILALTAAALLASARGFLMETVARLGGG